MRSRRWLLIASLLLLAAGLLSAACGGSADDDGPPDLTKISTATPPDPLPEPIIVGETMPVLPGGATYTVQAGDNPSSIADRFGTTMEAIIQANDIVDPTRLEVGQVLIIPGAGSGDGQVLGTTAEPPRTPEPSGEGTYTVQAGDNASNIADRFGITLDELAAANDTTINDLRSLSVGDVLTIPSPRATATPEPPAP